MSLDSLDRRHLEKVGLIVVNLGIHVNSRRSYCDELVFAYTTSLKKAVAIEYIFITLNRNSTLLAPGNRQSTFCL